MHPWGGMFTVCFDDFVISINFIQEYVTYQSVLHGLSWTGCHNYMGRESQSSHFCVYNQGRVLFCLSIGVT